MFKVFREASTASSGQNILLSQLIETSTKRSHLFYMAFYSGPVNTLVASAQVARGDFGLLRTLVCSH